MVINRYQRDGIGALALYVGLLAASNILDDRLSLAGPLRVVVALLPMIGAAAFAAVVVRKLRACDELQRRIQLDAISGAFLGTALLTLGWGFAESAGVPKLPTVWIWPIMGTLWVVGLVVARRRYR